MGFELADKYVSLVQELSEYRIEYVENIAGLLETKAWATLKTYLTDPTVRQCLTDIELDFLESILIKNGDQPNRLN